MADSDDISSQFFTRTEAAAWLGQSEKTLLRLINSKKIRAEKRTAQGKKRWVIKGSELVLYRLQKRGWFRRTFSPIPPIAGYPKHCGFIFMFGEVMEQVSPRGFAIHEPNQRFELTVSLDELSRFVRPPQSEKEVAKLKHEIRSRLRHAPENFNVRFRLGKSTQQTLERIVKSVTAPNNIPGVTPKELKQAAITHVLYRVLPDLWRAKQDWTHYAKRAVKNFYKDQARLHRARLAHFDDAIDLDRFTDLSAVSDVDVLDYSIAARANARAKKRKPRDDLS